MGAKKLSVAAYNSSFFRHNDSYFLTEKDKKIIGEQLKKANIDVKKSGIGLVNLKDNSTIDLDTENDDYIEKVDKNTKKNKFDEWENRTHCSGGRSSFVITPDGKIMLYDTVPQEDLFFVGDISNQSIMEIWHSEKLKEFAYSNREKFTGTLCYDCEHLDDCLSSPAGYCFRISYFNYDKKFAPPPECPMVNENGLRIEYLL